MEQTTLVLIRTRFDVSLPCTVLGKRVGPRLRELAPRPEGYRRREAGIAQPRAHLISDPYWKYEQN